MYYASGGIDGCIYKGIVLGGHLVVVVKNLDAEQLANDNQRCRAQAYEKLGFPVVHMVLPPVIHG